MQAPNERGDSAADEDDLIGTLVADRYRIVRRVGRGGMGTVYLAVHEKLRKQVALKLLDVRAGNDKEVVARFEREAIASANLRHPNIAEASDFGRLPDGALYLVMEFIDGKSAQALVDASPGGLPPARAVRILGQVAAALVRAHGQDVVHRDLKPDNILVFDRNDERDVVKVIDFGIARIRSAVLGAGAKSITIAGAVFGTPEYMAPEQVLGQPADARADQYAFGVTAFELLTGRVPYSESEVSRLLMKHVSAPIPDVRDFAPHLPPAASAVLSKLLAKKPDDRYASIAEAFAALEAALAGAAPSSGTVRMDGPPAMSSPGLPSPAGALSPSLSGPLSSAGGPMSPPAGGPMSPPAGGPMSPPAGGPILPGKPVSPQAGGPMSPPAGGQLSTSPPGQLSPSPAGSLSPSSAGPFSPGQMSPSPAGPLSSSSPGPVAATSSPTASWPVAAAQPAVNLLEEGIPGPQPHLFRAKETRRTSAFGDAARRTMSRIGETSRDLAEGAADAAKKKPLLVGGASLGGALVLLLVVVLIVRAVSSPFPGEVRDALEDWEDGAFAKAAPPLRAELAKNAPLAADPAVARVIAGALQKPEGRGALQSLLDDTRLGRSPVMAAALADIALGEPNAARNGALRVLRGRGDLLPPEPRARVAYRDAVDCAALAQALNDLARAATPNAQADLERHQSGHCAEVIRREEICGCTPVVPGSGRGNRRSPPR